MARTQAAAPQAEPQETPPAAAAENEGASAPQGAEGGGDSNAQGSQSPSAEGDRGAEGDGGRGEAPPSPSPAQQQDWRDRRIAQLTAQLSRERHRSAGEGRPPSVPVAQPTPLQDATGAGGDPAIIERRANELAAQREFLRSCDEMQQAGRSEFGQTDFDARTGALRQLIDPNDPLEATAWNSLLIAARETGQGPRLLYELGADLNAAQRLLGLTPVKMAVELTKMASKAPSGGEGDESLASLATNPRPIRPIGARGPSHAPIEPDDPDRSSQLSIETWMRRRTEQVKSRGLR